VKRQHGALLGLLAAALFGLSVPLSKLLLADIGPQMLAGLLYLGAAAALWLWRAVGPAPVEAKLKREDVPMLAAIAVSGGVAAPVLLLVGLARVSAVAGSLLLNLEAPLTMLFAVALFREHLGRGALGATALIVAGAAALKLDPAEVRVDGGGVLLIGAACACWGLDNNLTQRLSLRDPLAIVRIKTLAAGAMNVLLARALPGAGAWPSARGVAWAAALGAASYGLSMVLHAYALRLLGAARVAAYFATAPFLGALLALGMGERLGAWDAAAMAAMALGVALMARDHHEHEHHHEALEHDHAHVHDDHHQHAHAADDPPGEPHTHAHRHEPLTHSHAHVSDLHHRHRHG
jgi:drug/metabolite transporter (DMT)-like permease